jgi:HEAT repeat protein
MKKSVIFFILISAVTVLGFAVGEDIDVYVHLYNSSPTTTAQLDVLQNMAGASLSGAGEFYSSALKRLLSEYRNIKNVTEKNAADEQAMLLASLLGTEKYTQAAPDLWAVVDVFEAPLVKSEAMIALGKIRATAYLPRIIRILESTNVAPTANRLEGERIAFGTIVALEKYQDPSGYLPVFFASVGWYSKRIQDQAVRSLDFIAEDPVPYMLNIVKGASFNYDTKYAAVKAVETSKRVNNKKKADVAVAGLGEGWRSSTSDAHNRVVLADMRKLSIQMINKYRTDDEAIYPLLERSYTLGDMDEKLATVAALASQRTAKSAEQLSKFLMDLNVKRLNGNIKQEDEQAVRAIIPALGQTGRPEGRPALASVSASGWPPAVAKLADDAIKQTRN